MQKGILVMSIDSGQTSNKSRIEWIDQLRGMAVILVVLQHAGLRGAGRFILAFHMPLFFFISGLLFQYNNNSKANAKIYINRMVCRIAFPYTIYVCFYWIINYALIPIFMGRQNHPVEFFRPILHDIVYLNRYYFISCLFIGSIIYYFYRRVLYLKKAKSESMYIALLMLISIFLAWLIDEFTLPFQLEKVPVVIAFLCMGSLSGAICRIIYEDQFSLNKVIAMFVINMSALIIFTFANYLFEDGANFMLYISEYGNYLFAYPGAIAGIFMMIAINKLWCEKVKFTHSKKILSILSRYSILIYPAHLWGVNFGKTLSKSFSYHWFVAFVVNLILAIICIVIAIKAADFLPILNGEKR